MKDEDRNLLIDEIAIANRWKEYVEELYREKDYTNQLVVNSIEDDLDSNLNTGILKSETSNNEEKQNTRSR